MQYKKGEEASDSITLEISQLRQIETQCSICRVIEPLRNVNSKAYDPEILAIGPYHHGKDAYKMMEEHKLRYLQSILNRRPQLTAERYISVVSEVEEEARSCYAEAINLNQDNFIKMLVLDGCFIIELALKFNDLDYRYRNDPIYTVQLIRSCLRRDLILFENQIPFFILCKLFDLIEGPNQCDRLINLLLGFCECLFPYQDYKKPKDRNLSDVKHLLDLIYRCWTPESFDGAIDLNKNDPIPENTESRFIPPATELNDANVKFQKREPSDSLFEVKFHNGTLLIPPLIISNDTDCFFRNLIAYEQYFGDVRKNYVGAYVNFMDFLINSSKDVDILNKCGVIDLLGGDHEEIASMFNKLTDSIISSPEDVYGKTFMDINTYRNKRRNRWMAVLNRDYFSNPWGFISIFAAFVLLILTITQAVCSILQVVYT